VSLSTTELTGRVQAVLREELKDRKLVEIEITEAIVTRLSSWAKLLGFFVGVPLAALALILAVLGIRNYSDFSRSLDTAKKDVEQTFQRARQEAQQHGEQFKERIAALRKEGEDLSARSEELKTRYQRLQTELAGLDTLAKNVRTLATKVERIEQRIGFEPSPALTPDLRKRLETSFGDFMRYLAGIGFTPNDRVRIRVDAKVQANAYFVPSENLIVIGESLASDPHVVYRTYAHYALGTFLKMVPASAAVESGLADYFTCSSAIHRTSERKPPRSFAESESTSHTCEPWTTAGDLPSSALAPNPTTPARCGAQRFGRCGPRSDARSSTSYCLTPGHPSAAPSPERPSEPRSPRK